jgi:gamma-glutamyltranspeptidase/glutathione hydrolase
MRSLTTGLLAAVLVALLAPPVQAQPDDPTDRGGDRLTGPRFARSPVVAQNGIAATSQPLASQVAVDVLKKGGSAVDAAIAANAALGLMEPTGNGLGGDLFAIVYDPETDSVHGLNASGRSPRGLSYDEMQEALGDRDEIPLLGHLPVSVPGTASGWGKLHERFGSLPLEADLRPAIRYAREGFPLSKVIAYYWQGNVESFRENADMLPDSENWKETYLIEGEDGAMRAPREGEIFRNPDLANTLETIAENGTDAFYEGEIARTIADYAERTGGYLRMEDFREHEANWVDPVSVDYRGVEVFELPPNGQGIAALQMLQILEGFDLAAMGRNSTDYLHVQAEAKKLVFEDRARFYADMDFADVPVQELISEEYAAERRRMIEMDEVLSEPTHGDPRAVARADAKLEEGDTIYLTVADSTGMMVSLIQSNYAGMGSGLVPDGLGFMLQDRGALFTMEEGHPNVYEPGKRPFHTIIPAFATKDGEPYLSFGVMGGGMQPQGHVQAIANIVDFGLDVQAAGDAARYRHYGSSSPTGETMEGRGLLRVESGVPEDVVRSLRGRGHAVEVGAGGYGGYQAIRWDPEEGVYWGGTEMRKDGTVVGY